MAYHNFHGLETRIVRIFNTYGPGMSLSDTRVVPSMMRRALTGEPLTIYGDGSASRDFTYVANAVHANLLAARREGLLDGEAFNVGVGERVTVLELAREMASLVAERFGATAVAPRFADPRPGDVPHSLADLSRSRRALGYEPVVGFREGLRHTLAWYVARRAGGPAARR